MSAKRREVEEIEAVNYGDIESTARVVRCRHLRTDLGERFEYCEDCGAVRVRSRPPEAWHSCPACLLPSPGGRAHGEMIATMAARGEE